MKWSAARTGARSLKKSQVASRRSRLTPTRSQGPKPRPQPTGTHRAIGPLGSRWSPAVLQDLGVASRRGKRPGELTSLRLWTSIGWGAVRGARQRLRPAPQLLLLSKPLCPPLAREGTAQAVAASPVRTRRRRRKTDALVGLLLPHPAPQQARRPGAEPPRARPASGPGRRRWPATAPLAGETRPRPAPPRRHGGAALLTAAPPPGLSAPPAAPAPSLACPRRLSRGC